jgi:hypothetical protein
LCFTPPTDSACFCQPLAKENNAMVLVTRLIGVLIILSALLTGGFALFLYLDMADFVERAEETTATVAGFEQSTHDGSTMYSPILAYVDKAGQKREATSGTSSSTRSHSVGDEITVLYDPDQPSKVRVNAFWSLWLGVVITSGLAGFALLMGLTFLILAPIVIRTAFRDVQRFRRGEPIA